MRAIAITDIHGCAASFKALLSKIQFTKEDHLYLLGDYIDRGPDSKGVIDHIFYLQSEGFTVTCLLGNHEQMLMDSITDKDIRDVWMRNGGDIALKSFGIDSVFEMPKLYMDFFYSLPYYIEIPDFILVHAGLNFKAADPLKDFDAMLWIRRFPIDLNYLNGRKIIHGHTPIAKEEIEYLFRPDAKLLAADAAVVDIDAGCVFKGRRAHLGYLCGLDLTNWRPFFQENIDF